jgi:hypothetical protein
MNGGSGSVGVQKETVRIVPLVAVPFRVEDATIPIGFALPTRSVR